MLRLLPRLRTQLYQVHSAVRCWYFRNVWGMTIGNEVKISLSARLDRTNPRGIHIGDATLISFDAAILTHDFVSSRHVDTFIGSHCFIGARTVIMPGIRIGNHCIIGSGSVVTADVPDNSLVVGNPARILKSNIVTGRWGIRAPGFLRKEGIAVPDDPPELLG
jgi:acetyltransferase-like isoleucine patch superfamily enzyme